MKISFSPFATIAAVALTTSLSLIPSTSHADAAQDAELAKRQARSVHLWWETQQKLRSPGLVFYNEARIQKSVNGSYFMSAGFDGGYFGLQQISNEKHRVAIFSVWDPGSPHDYNKTAHETPHELRTKVLGVGKNVYISRFGNEGTGAKSMLDFQWQENVPYGFLVAATPAPNHEGTIFSGHLYDPTSKKWHHMATFQTKNRQLEIKGIYSFVEDFHRNYKSATQVRKAQFGNTWIYTKKDHWVPMLKTVFTADGTPSKAIDAQVVAANTPQFMLQTGGDTKNVNPIYSELKTPLSDEKIKQLVAKPTLPSMPKDLFPLTKQTAK